MIKLGDECKDAVSGFRGIAFGETNFLNGCKRIGIQPPVGADGKLPEACWFDEPQVLLIKAGKVKCGPKDTGGPMVSVPTRNASPAR